MKRIIPIIILSLILISCSGVTTKPENRGFNLKFSYGGVFAKNVLNTFQNTYTKGLILGGPKTVPFILSESDMKRISDKMIEINFYDYPDTFVVHTDSSIVMASHYPTYTFEVSNKSSRKYLRWEDEIQNPNVQATKLRELISLIIKIIESKPEYLKLPPEEGGYI